MNKRNNKREQKKGVFGYTFPRYLEHEVALYPDGFISGEIIDATPDDTFALTHQQGWMCTYSDGSFDFIPKRQTEGRPQNFSYEILNKTAHGEVRKYANTLVLKLKVNLAEGPSVMRQFDAEYLNLSNEVADQLYNQN